MKLALTWFSFFFFSSRRRHTRCSRDWSSDVCSSDLVFIFGFGFGFTGGFPNAREAPCRAAFCVVIEDPSLPSRVSLMCPSVLIWPPQIGRASCRERV